MSKKETYSLIQILQFQEQQIQPSTTLSERVKLQGLAIHASEKLLRYGESELAEPAILQGKILADFQANANAMLVKPLAQQRVLEAERLDTRRLGLARFTAWLEWFAQGQWLARLAMVNALVLIIGMGAGFYSTRQGTEELLIPTAQINQSEIEVSTALDLTHQRAFYDLYSSTSTDWQVLHAGYAQN